jgi:hypothetical protein
MTIGAGRISDMVERPREFALVALSMGGVAWVLMQYVVGRQMGMFPIPGGDTMLWDRTGDFLRAGEPVYRQVSEPFFYAPPVAVLLGALTWLPPAVLNLATTLIAIVSLRLIGGSWLAAGLVCWFPLTVFALVDGNVNLLIAASIVLAVRGDGRLAAMTALMKVSPAIVIRDRRAVLVLAIAVAVTLPFLGLWPQWIGHMIGAFGHTYGPMIPVPLFLRLAVAAPLLLGRPWMRALGASIAIPGLYWGSLVVFVAPLAVWWRDRVPAGR